MNRNDVRPRYAGPKDGAISLFYFGLSAAHTPADLVNHRPVLCGHWQPALGTRETQGKAIQQPGNCTPLFLALALAYEQKKTWQRSRIMDCGIVRLNISQHAPIFVGFRRIQFPLNKRLTSAITHHMANHGTHTHTRESPQHGGLLCVRLRQLRKPPRHFAKPPTPTAWKCLREMRLHQSRRRRQHHHRTR